ncbi:MAG: hypothetical protein ACTHU0_01340 [Kofleriaceae bacterium]
MDPNDPPPKPTLAATGHVFVSLAAAREYARYEGLQEEQARRELTDLLLDAREVSGEPGMWRTRKRSVGLDIKVRVVVEGRLHVVVRVHVRERNSSNGTGRGRVRS